MEYSESTSSNQGSHGGNGVHAIAARAEEKVREFGETAQHRIDAERNRVAYRIEDAAARVRERADAVGPIGHTAGETVAIRMDAAAGYLHEHRTNEIAGDLAAYVRRHPMRAVLGAAVIGYLIGRMTG